MTMTLLEPRDTRSAVSPAQWLRETTAAVRVSFTWLGVRKALTPEQRNQAADSFGAEGDYLSARKKLLDTKHTAYKEVTAIRGKVIAHWKALTLPFPEPGIRLIRQHQIDSFNQEMTSLRSELLEAVARLDQHYTELKNTAQRRLGDLFNAERLPAFSAWPVQHRVGFSECRATGLPVPAQPGDLRTGKIPRGCSFR